MNVLVLNIGSSSLKALLCALDEKATRWEARADWGHDPHQAKVRYKAGGQETEECLPMHSPDEIFTAVLRRAPAPLDAVGHRIVHGGADFCEPVRVTPEVKQKIQELAKYAPVHNRLELAGIEAAERVFGGALPQVAMFDTAFHQTLGAAAYTYGGPHAWLEQGIRRYGFHGINHQYVARRSAELLSRDSRGLRLVSCHLGNGCSLAAIADGASVDTTMGFTPLDGLVMGSRSGSVDPAILIHLMREDKHSADELDRVLNQESGLKGLSGISGDMRDIHAARQQGNARAQLAYEVFRHRLVREIGAMAAVLNGVDALAFTGGIGENDAVLRQDVCARVGYLGVPPERVLVVPAQEEWEIARAAARLLPPATA